MAERRRRGFNPVIDGTYFPGGPFNPEAPAVSAHVPLMIGSNKDEQSLFLGHLPWVTGATFDNLPAAMKPYLGDRAAEIVAKYHTAQPTLLADQIGLILMGELGQRLPSLQMAERKLALKGADVFVYLFAWETPVLGGRLRACHTLEIPFVFNTVDSAAITGTDPSRLPLGETMARAWIAFAKTGNPGWRPYDTTSRPTMVFDLESRVENDPFGAERRAWED
jgi:para-nitrobenzyl esterase